MKTLLIIAVLLIVIVGIFYLFPSLNYRKMPEGLIKGQLPEAKPNWVSSLAAKTDSHYIAPLKMGSLIKLSACIESKLPEVKIIEQNTSKLIAYRSSPFFHFVDWICIHSNGEVISSATMGHSDFGKNRELVEKIRALCS